MSGFSPPPFELPADVRFYHDLCEVREDHIANAEETIGKNVTCPDAWMEIDNTPLPIDFRGADTATTNVLVYSSADRSIGFDLRLRKNDKQIRLPQDQGTEDEILKFAREFYGDSAEEEMELSADDPFYQVIAVTEHLPVIVNWHLWGNVDTMDCINARNSTLLTPEECTELIRYAGSLVPSIKAFSSSFVCR